MIIRTKFRFHASCMVGLLALSACSGESAKPNEPTTGDTKQSPPSTKATDPSPASTVNPHAIDPSADATGHSCYAAFREPQSCAKGFAAVTACATEADATLLRGGLEAVKDEGCYYFCPNVENCASLSMDEVADLACKYAAANDIAPALSLRSVCGPETNTKFGPCCFGVDAATLYD